MPITLLTTSHDAPNGLESVGLQGFWPLVLSGLGLEGFEPTSRALGPETLHTKSRKPRSLEKQSRKLGLRA